jgi:hypothetical protein
MLTRAFRSDPLLSCILPDLESADPPLRYSILSFCVTVFLRERSGRQTRRSEACRFHDSGTTRLPLDRERIHAGRTQSQGKPSPAQHQRLVPLCSTYLRTVCSGNFADWNDERWGRGPLGDQEARRHCHRAGSVGGPLAGHARKRAGERFCRSCVAPSRESRRS